MTSNKLISAVYKVGGFMRHQVGLQEPTVAYVGGWLGKKNLGDELLRLAYARLFPRLAYCHYDGGRVASKLYQWTPRRRGGFLAGGTLVGQHRMWLEYAQAFVQHGDPFVIFGSGVANPVLWPDGAPLAEWKPLLDQARFLGVRGPVSAQFLQDAGIREPEIVGDPAIVFARDSEKKDYLPNSLAINIGVADQRMWGSAETVRDEMATLAQRAREAGWKVTWLVVWPKDLAITRAAAEVSGTAEEVKEIYTDHEAFMDVAAQASVMVGMKLHATVLATCAGTPSVMLEYRSKCRDYMESIDHGEWVVRTDQVVGDELWGRVQEMNRGRHDLAANLMSRVQALRTRQIQSASRLESELIDDLGK